MLVPCCLDTLLDVETISQLLFVLNIICSEECDHEKYTKRSEIVGKHILAVCANTDNTHISNVCKHSANSIPEFVFVGTWSNAAHIVYTIGIICASANTI